MLKTAHLLAGFAALLLSFILGFSATDAGLLHTPDTVYLGLFGLLNLLAALIPSSRHSGLRQQGQSLASALFILAVVLQSLILLAPLTSIGGQPAAWLSLLTILVATLLHLACHLAPQPRATLPEYKQADSSPVISQHGRETGTVKWFNTSKGFGFISRDSGEDIFVHFRAIRGEGHRVLVEGQRVEFSVMQRDKGLQAEDVIAALPSQR